MTLKSFAPCHIRRTLRLFSLAKDFPQMNQASRVEMSNIILWKREELYGQIHHMSHISLQKQEQESQGIVSKAVQNGSEPVVSHRSQFSTIGNY